MNEIKRCLYYVRLDLPDRAPLWKVGITNHRHPSRRFPVGEREHVTVLRYWRATRGSTIDGRTANEWEQLILEEQAHRLINTGWLESGNSETFGEDIVDYIDARLPIARLALPRVLRDAWPRIPAVDDHPAFARSSATIPPDFDYAKVRARCALDTAWLEGMARNIFKPEVFS